VSSIHYVHTVTRREEGPAHAFVGAKVNMDTKIILRPVAGRSAMYCISPVNAHTGEGVSGSAPVDGDGLPAISSVT
jgi:hypothetical protein